MFINHEYDETNCKTASQPIYRKQIFWNTDDNNLL